MALPMLLIIPALISLAGFGVKKGIDAVNIQQEAKDIATRAKRRHDRAVKRLKTKASKTNEYLEELGKLKILVFSNQIKHLVDTLRRLQTTKSTLHDFEITFSTEEFRQAQAAVSRSLEIAPQLGSGIAAGALTALGAYGSVGALAAASTSTAIATLSGAAATNATLAWLGGGSLAAGGLGMTGGIAVLGGIAVAPALAIMGFAAAGKAEKSLTKATAYEAKLNIAVAEIKKAVTVLKGVDENIAELTRVILRLSERYDAAKVDDLEDHRAFETMLRIGKALKTALDQKIMTKRGVPVKKLRVFLKGFADL